MSYNAGSIDSRLTLDRSAFTRELRAARAEADAFSRNPIKVKLELQRFQADAELAAFQRRMEEATRTRHARIVVDVDRNAVNELRRIQDEINRLPNSGRRASQEVQQQFSLMRAAIELLGPALIPIAGGALAGGAALVGLGAAGLVAVKSIMSAMKQGGPAALDYAAGIQTIKTDWSQLQDTVGKAIKPGFNKAIQDLHSAMPQVNQDLAASSKELGSIADHIVHGLVGGLHTFAPLIHEVEVDIDHVAARFDAWATGPGGEKFAKTLSEDWKQTTEFLGQTITLVGNIISAYAPLGGIVLHSVTELARMFNELDRFTGGALGKLLVFSYTISRLVTYLNLATAALTRMAAAEAAAGAAGAGAGAVGAAGAGAGARAAGLGATALALAKRAALPIAVTEAVSSLGSSQTAGWRTSQNPAEFYTANILQGLSRGFSLTGLKDLATLHLGSFVNFVGGPARDNRDSRNAFSYLQGQNQLYGPGGSQAGQAYHGPNGQAQTATSYVLPQGGYLGISKLVPVYHDLTNAELEEQQAAALSSVTHTKLNAIFSQTALVANRQPLDQAAQGYASLATSLNKQVDVQSKWLDQGGKTILTLKGVKIGQNTLLSALQQTNGDYPKAIGLIEGHISALHQTKAAQAEAAAGQANIDAALGEAETKYKLTSDQVSLYAGVLGVSAEQLAKGTVATGAFVQGIGMVAREIQNGNTAVQGWVTAVDAWNKSAQTAADRGQLIAAALVSFQGPALAYANTMVAAATANQQMVTDLLNVKKGVIDLKTGTIDFHNAGAAPLLADLAQLQQNASQAAAATYQLEVSHKGAKQAAKDAALVFKNDTTKALEDEFVQIGHTKGEADKLAQRYFNWPKDAITQIQALGAKDTNTLLDALGQQLSILTGKPWLIDVNVNVHETTSVKGKGSFSYLPGSTGTGAAGAIYFAGGGENHVAQIATPTYRVWAEPETQGEAYIPFANDWRRPRARAITQQVAHRLGGVARFAGGGGTEPGGFTGVDYGSGTGSSSSSAAAAASKATTTLQQELSALVSAMSSLAGQVHPVNALAGAFTALAKAIRDANQGAGDQRLIRMLREDEAALSRDMRARDKFTAAVAAWRSRLTADRSALGQFRNQVRDTYLGQFDIGTSGNGYAYGIKATLEQAIADTTKESSLIAKAKSLGLDPRLVSQLEQEGPQGAKNLQAIVSQGKSYVSTINADYAKLVTASNAIANTAAKDSVTINRRIAHDNHEIALNTRRMHAEQEKTNHDLQEIRALVAKLERELKNRIVGVRKG